jgi:hypothetical protein
VRSMNTFPALLFMHVLEEKQKKYEAHYFKGERWLWVMLILLGLTFLRNAQGDVCWPEIFLKCQKRCHTPHFFLKWCPKFCSFVQYATKLVMNVLLDWKFLIQLLFETEYIIPCKEM